MDIGPPIDLVSRLNIPRKVGMLDRFSSSLKHETYPRKCLIDLNHDSSTILMKSTQFFQEISKSTEIAENFLDCLLGARQYQEIRAYKENYLPDYTVE